MAYSELVKRFDLVRDYMRDFLIFGFKTREDFDRKSGRTYDNERRRIESWLGDSLRWEYRAGGKALFLSLDAGTLSRNPLYRAWQSKSFTDNDILLHFFLLDLLADGRPRHAEAITDELLEAYDQVFEPLTVRRKLKEYAQLGILRRSRAAGCAIHARPVRWKPCFPTKPICRNCWPFSEKPRRWPSSARTWRAAFQAKTSRSASSIILSPIPLRIRFCSRPFRPCGGANG